MQETPIEQSSPSNSLPVLYKKDNYQSIVNDPSQEAIRLWTTLSDKDTAVTYQKALDKTWQIFKQIIPVVLFLLTLTIAVTVWTLGIAFHSGRNLRYWLEIEQPSPLELVYALFQFLASPLKLAYEWSVSFIKKYLGWEIKFKLPSEVESISK